MAETNLQPQPSAAELQTGVRAAVLKPEQVVQGVADLTPEQTLNARRGAEQVRAGQGLEGMRTLACGLNRPEWRRTLDSQIQTDFAPDGTRIAAPRTNEATRLTESKNLMDAYEGYLQKGYDGLEDTPGGQTAAEKQTALRAKMEELIRSNQNLFDALTAHTNGTLNQETIESFLRQDGVRIELAKSLNELLKPDSVPAPLEAQFRQAKSNLATKTTERQALVDEKARYENAANEKTNFETGATYNFRGGTTTKTEAMGILKGELGGSADLGVRSFEKNLDRLDVVNKQLVANPADAGLIAEKADLENWIKGAKTDAADGAKCTEFESLYKESKDIEQRIADAGTKIPELDGKIQTKNQEAAEAQIDLNDKTVQRQTMSAEFSGQVDGALAKAAEDYAVARAAEFITVLRNTKGGVGKEVLERYKGQIINVLDSRWFRARQVSGPAGFIIGKLGRSITRGEVNKEQARSDFAALLTQGPDQFLDQIWQQAGITDTNERLLMTRDTEFMKTQRADITAKTLAAYVGGGGRLTENHIRALALTSYGEAAIQGIIDKSAKAKELIKKAQENGILKEGTVQEVWKKTGNKGLLGLILAGLGIAAIGGYRLAVPS